MPSRVAPQRASRDQDPQVPRIKGDQPPRNTRLRRNGHGDLFRPGDTVRESGIYEVVHHAGHRTAHEVVMVAGDFFPTCDTCSDNVRFRLLRTAPYIFADEDFEENES